MAVCCWAILVPIFRLVTILDWLDSTIGDNWVLVTDNPEIEELATYPINDLYVSYVCPITVPDDNFVPFSGDQIRYGFRFGSMVTLSEDEKNQLRSIARAIKLYPLLETPNYMGYMGPAYILDINNGIGISAGSDIRSDRDYIYVEINNIPNSSTSRYALVIGVIDIEQSIMYSKSYAIVLKE